MSVSGGKNAVHTYVRWGFWATLGWSVLITLLLLIIQRFVFGMFVGEYYPDYLQKYYENITSIDVNRLFQDFQFNGTVHSLLAFILFFASVMMLTGVIKLKKGSDIKDYLALRIPTWKSLEVWFIVVFVYLTVANILILLMEKSVPPEFISKLYISTQPRWLIWGAGIIITPVFEELFIRGFIMSGLERTFVRPIGAVLISSAIWAVMYMQLESHLIIQIYIFGVILGMARFHSRSIYLPIGLHMLVNFFILLMTMNHLSMK